MIRTRLLVAGMFLFAAACSNNDASTTTDETTITADMASAAADGVAEDVDVMTTMDGNIAAVAGASLSGPGDWHPGLTGCTFAGGTFTCPATTRRGLTVTRTISLFDAGGATEAAFDALLTASIHVVADISGEASHGPWTATILRHRDFTVTGLAGTETTRTVNGTGTESVTHFRDTNHPRAYDIAGSSIVTNVVLPVRAADGGNGWPISGTITRTFTVTVTQGGNAGHVTTRTVTITFNGTSSVTATVNGVEFTIDLSGHTATPHG